MTTAAGPRPLRLANSSDSPSTPSTPSTPLTPASRVGFTSRTPNPRRQSSISYLPSPRDGEPTSPALFNPRHASLYVPPNYVDAPTISSPKPPLNRSSSVGSRRSVDGLPTRTFATPTTPVTERPYGRPNSKRISTGSMLEPTVEEKERGPLTLVEKHADLLHFIAQKESKCLELRTQLAAHEAELLELKKKWERIVSRGLERSQSQSTSTSPLPSGSQSSASPLIHNSPLSNPNTSPSLSNVYSAASLSYLENLSTQAQGVGGASVLEALGGMKGIRESVQQGVERILGVVAGSEPVSPHPSSIKGNPTSHNPSQSTSSVATASSSTSFYTATSDAGTRLSYSSQSSVDVIPEEGHNEVKTRHRPVGLGGSVFTDTGATPLTSPTSEFGFSFEGYNTISSSTSVSRSNSARSRRRKKQISSVEKAEENSSFESEENNGKDHSESDSLSSSLLDWSPLEDSSALREAKQMNNYAKRISLPPLDGSSMSSWVGNMVGKTWEDRIHKNQKRASGIFSDVSQTLSQLVSPPQSATAPSQLRREPSLLDDDLPDSKENCDALRSVPLLQPSTPTPSIPMKLESTPKKSKTTPPPSSQRQDDDEDEWNW